MLVKKRRKPTAKASSLEEKLRTTNFQGLPIKWNYNSLWPSFRIPTLHAKEEALSVFFIVFMECNKKICLLKFRKYFPCKPGVNNWFKKNFLVCIHDFILFLPIIDKVFSLWPTFFYTKKEQLIKAFFSTFRVKVRHKFYNAQLSTYHLFPCNI